MLKNKLFITAMVSCTLSVSAVCAETLSDITYPKPPAYRVGISSEPENQYIEAQHAKVKPEKTFAQLDNTQEASVADLTYADLSIRRLSKEIAQELEYEEQDMVSDLSLLWQGAAIQSDTINFALYKLANPDADKPDSKSIKNVLRTIASMSTLVGASVGSPALAGASLIGGNILGIMSQDTKALNYKYTKVGDADMIILIRKVEDLQQRAVNLYYDYMSAKQQYEFATKLVEERQEKFHLAQKNNASRELIVITDAYYRTALDKQRTAKSDFFSKRAALEQFVGNETFVQFEQELTARENGESIPERVTKETQEDYDNTIQRVEEYTNTVSENSEKPIIRMQKEEIAGVADISELPNLEEMQIAHESEALTGSSSNVEQSNKKSKFKNTTKPEKNSTKGLIFLHSDNPRMQEDTSRYDDGFSLSTAPVEVQETPLVNKTSKKIKADKKTVSSKKKSKTPQVAEPPAPSKNNEFKFAPLDEIKIPELRPGGYSIYDECL